LWDEAVTRPRHLVFSPRRDRDETFPEFLETETFKNRVSRPFRERDVETETTSLAGGMTVGVHYSVAEPGDLRPCTLSRIMDRISSAWDRIYDQLSLCVPLSVCVCNCSHSRNRNYERILTKFGTGIEMDRTSSLAVKIGKW
jgi:hypothetical protein